MSENVKQVIKEEPLVPQKSRTKHEHEYSFCWHNVMVFALFGCAMGIFLFLVKAKAIAILPVVCYPLYGFIKELRTTRKMNALYLHLESQLKKVPHDIKEIVIEYIRKETQRGIHTSLTSKRREKLLRDIAEGKYQLLSAQLEEVNTIEPDPSDPDGVTEWQFVFSDGSKYQSASKKLPCKTDVELLIISTEEHILKALKEGDAYWATDEYGWAR